MEYTPKELGELFFRFSSAFATPFEEVFHPQIYVDFAQNNRIIVITVVILYLLFCFYGQKLMAGRTAFGLRLTLAAWNALLCTFSFIGMLRTVPFLLGRLLTESYEDTVCRGATESYGQGPVGCWVMLFIFSKLPELVDTVFIVLRKKSLIFLHWYHHVTVLMYCWHAYETLAGSGLYFVAMNYSVHAMMYGYFCLQALNVCPKNFPAYLITAAQIAQMFVGTGVCISCWYFKYHPKDPSSPCENDLLNLYAGALMYGSYLMLFLHFALGKYFTKKSSPKKEL